MARLQLLHIPYFLHTLLCYTYVILPSPTSRLLLHATVSTDWTPIRVVWSWDPLTNTPRGSFVDGTKWIDSLSTSLTRCFQVPTHLTSHLFLRSIYVSLVYLAVSSILISNHVYQQLHTCYSFNGLYLYINRQTVNLDDVQYCMDGTLPDRVYLGAIFDFQQTSVQLMTIPIGNEEPVLPYRGQVTSGPSTPESTTNPAVRATTHHVQDANMGLASIGSFNTSGLLNPDVNDAKKTKRSRSKPSKSGVSRPPNCWMLFRRFWDGPVSKANPGMKTPQLCKHIAIESFRWVDINL